MTDARPIPITIVRDNGKGYYVVHVPQLTQTELAFFKKQLELLEKAILSLPQEPSP